MNQGVVNFKVFLKDDSNSDARRFSVDDPSVVTNFMFMKQKIETVFPVLQGHAFKITWKDTDGDEITITSDEDLITAFTDMSGALKVLHVTIIEPMMGAEDASPRVFCDVCQNIITGFRYKCMQCLDYDLCAGCETKGNHAHHFMLRSSQQQLPRCMPRLMSFVSRSMRKASLNASKDTYRAFKEHGKQASKENRCHKGADFRAGCPAMDAFSFNDLANMAAPFLEALQHHAKVASDAAGASSQVPSDSSTQAGAFSQAANEHAQPTSTSTNVPPFIPQQPTTNPNIEGTPSGDALASIIRSAVQNIFGTNVQQQQPSAPNASAESSTHQSTPAPTTPMEVEPPKEALYPQLFIQKEKTPEPGWTFVMPSSNAAPGSNAANIPQAPNRAAGESELIQEGYAKLIEMGFSDEIDLVNLLKRFEGNVGLVIRHLLENK